MPRLTGKWKRQDQTNWLVLDKLVRKGPQAPANIEGKKGKYELSHTSVRIGIEYLQKRYLISEISVDESIPKRPIRTFDATTLGVLVWFVKNVKDEKINNTQQVLKNIHELLPIISKKWETLTKYYEEQHMIKLLVKVFSNMEILAEDPITIKYKTFYRGVTMEFKNTQDHKKFLETVLKLVNSKEFKRGFESVVNFAFFLELYKLYRVGYYDYDEEVGFIGKPDVKNWLKIIKSDEKLFGQIKMGFHNMKESSETTDEGIRKDLDLILGKDKKVCSYCGRIYKNEEEHYTSHQNIHEKETPKISKKQALKKYMNNFMDYQSLLFRSEYEYELEFQREKVLKFTDIFKI